MGSQVAGQDFILDVYFSSHGWYLAFVAFEAFDPAPVIRVIQEIRRRHFFDPLEQSPVQKIVFLVGLPEFLDEIGGKFGLHAEF